MSGHASASMRLELLHRIRLWYKAEEVAAEQGTRQSLPKGLLLLAAHEHGLTP